MNTILASLGAFLIGSGGTAFLGRYFFLMGWQLGRDDLALDPGETTGQLPAVGESSGRHAKDRIKIDPPEPADPEQTVTIPAVAPDGGIVSGGPEVRE